MELGQIGTYFNTIQTAMDGTKLTPYFKIWTGEEEWPVQIKKYVANIVIKKKLGLIADEVTITIYDPDYTIMNYGMDLCRVGAPMKVEIGVLEDLDRSNFLVGNVQEFRPDFPESGVPTITLVVLSLEHLIFKKTVSLGNRYIPYHTFVEDHYECSNVNTTVKSWVMKRVILMSMVGMDLKQAEAAIKSGKALDYYDIDPTDDPTLVQADKPRAKLPKKSTKKTDKDISGKGRDSDYDWIIASCGQGSNPEFVAYLDRGKFYFKKIYNLLSPDKFRDDLAQEGNRFYYREKGGSLGKFSVSFNLSPIAVQVGYHSSKAKDIGKTYAKKSENKTKGTINANLVTDIVWDVRTCSDTIKRVKEQLEGKSK